MVVEHSTTNDESTEEETVVKTPPTIVPRQVVNKSVHKKQ
jgi:hypothetical protein